MKISISVLMHLLSQLSSNTPCRFDHHGYCQEHAWLTTEEPCAHKQAQEILEEWKNTAPLCPSCGDNINGTLQDVTVNQHWDRIGVAFVVCPFCGIVLRAQQDGDGYTITLPMKERHK